MSLIVGWDPERGARFLPRFRAAAAGIEAEGRGTTPWVSGDDSLLTNGTRVHLMLQGAERGIVGVGTVCSSPFLSFDGDGPITAHVLITWLALLPEDDRITVAELAARVPGVDWDRLYTPEIQLDADSAARLERVWLAPHPSAAPGPGRRLAARRLAGAPTRRTAVPAQARFSRSAAAL